MRILNNRVLVILFSLALIFGISSMAFAQMKTPSPYDKKPMATPKPGDDAEEDDYYEEEQAGGIDYEEQVVELDKELIQGVIKKRYTGIQYCYEKELQTNQALKGHVVVNFTINLDGKVSGVKLVGKKTSLTDKKVTDCVLDIMKSLAFPVRKAGEPIEINYPFNFQPKAK